MAVVRVRGNDLFYAASGEVGPTVVLIHGAGGNHLHWPPSLRTLPGARVCALDLPGHGRSGGAGRKEIGEYAADVVGLLDGLGVERAVLIGHSMGGAIAQSLALTYPERAAGLVLVGTGARLRVAPAILDGIRQDFHSVVRLITEWAWGQGTDPALVEKGRELMEEVDPEVLLGDFLACDRFDVREQAAQIAAPTLVITGSEDRMTPPRFGEWLAEHIPAARFLLIEGAGHMVALEKPSEVSTAVQAWLKETGLSG